jgi:hypothetical protein
MCAVVVLAACAPHRQESCLVATPPSGGPPLLLRIGVAPTRVVASAPAGPLCSATRPMAFECEAVDDLSGLLGTGVACGPGGAAPQRVCPALGHRITRVAAASNPKKPCGEASCDNVEVAIDVGGDTMTHLTFYDDPSCHGGPPEPACQSAVHKCYYRLLSTTVTLKGPVD